MASLINLVGVNKISSTGDSDGPVCLVSRVSFQRNGLSFRRFWSSSDWPYSCVCKCKYSATAEGNSMPNSTYRRSNSDNSNDKYRRGAPKPMLKPVPKVDPGFTMSWDEVKHSRKSENEKLMDGEERSKVSESLGEVLEKVEKIKTGKKASIFVNKPPDDGKTAKPVNSVKNFKSKTKTFKSVWRKGNSVATVQKVVHEIPKQEHRTDAPEVDASESVSQLRSHQPPQNVRLKLQGKPPVDANGVDLASELKVQKPILRDRFASKKPGVDPLLAQAVLAPPKPGKSMVSGKFKDEYRKKGIPSEGPPRRCMVDDGRKIYDEDTDELDISIPGATAARKGRKWTKARRKAARLQAARDAAPVRMEIMEVNKDGMLTEELACNLAVSEGEILGYLYLKGIKPDGVQKLSNDMVKMICNEYGVEVIDSDPTKVEEMAKKREVLDVGDLDQLEDRPPVLTIMGHVDHGKTTLLDYIRKSKVAAGEAGGITQGIGAYKVQLPVDGKTQTCVFLDTPGHEAFGAMRARGARVTDIAVIVVAADDSIQPQTNEAIAHARAAGVPIIVAINKIDKDGANPDRVLQDLSSIGLMPEDWGGDIPTVKVSALRGDNVDELLETIMLVAELQELKANPHRNAKGTVIEAGLDKAKGPVATFIVQNGTLKKGDIVICGEAFGKVRALFDDNGKRVDDAGPSIPVQVLGLNGVPLAGDAFEVVGSIAAAREKAEERAEYLRNEHITEKAGDGKVTLASFASAVSARKNGGLDLHQLNIILKVDVQGSIEAVRQGLQVLPQDNVTLKFILQGTGDVSTGDIDLAGASKAVIFGFNVRIPASVKSHADNKQVEVRLYKVIYELIDDVRNAMEVLLDPVEERLQIGLAEVRAVFGSGSGRVAGCIVTEGKLVKDCGIRVLRRGKEVHVGVLGSLRRVKEIVKEVNAGLECGIGVEGFNDWLEGDILEAFDTVQKRRTLEEASATMSAALKEAGIQL
ncbi:translation initiation factor IF-2, chloroplastic-like [Andrographis paniculata]|uniref:translation initiation factor IF-2, chloroplastic-like n=1 Tax=Andrographis paniculata TaxID=175694 RepID=UPI0021E76FFC|nr:translation initiation factor IF-2, chloroplastic-like [Andrographis paniculata]